MHPAVGIVVGIVLVVVGLALFFVPQLQPQPWWWVNQLVTVIAGMIPAFLILIGVFLVWLQADELKSKEPEKEEEEEKEEKPVQKKPKKKAK